MEFVLKHDKFAHLCDIESFPDSLRPLRLDTEAGKVKGLGCNEVWFLGQSHATHRH